MTGRYSRSSKYRSAARRGLAVAALTLALGAAAPAQNAPATPTVPSSTTPLPTPAAPATASPPPSSPTAQQAPAQVTPTPGASSGLTLPPQPPPPPLSAAPGDKRGFLNDFTKWWDQSIADFNSKMKEQQSKIDNFNKESSAAAKDAATATQQVMKSAADAVVRMSTPSSVIEIQDVCATAGNGAPDCEAAATKACMVKGFKSGQPLDIRTAEKCTASLWVSGQPPQTPADCPVETVLLRAACQ